MDNHKNGLYENNYDAPSIEVFEMKVECGIAESVKVMKNEDLI